ncbi:vacuolar protein sorting-associated protein 13 family protein [Tieghemostelium lacteum]|uniref:Vacuolar protein sorting-associated protein 13 family protein n=1 Tax=Tieghemostelium lacteum TaxID=361077 RepID=A0A152A369_TIELA|nr:vacuolar protein sorting-associated protein 13 family protein [Tieghemostelium lacteum]|eukprot:KYR00712.1 vacuolar protein sorting-associated protein 13 family protein [Tieghemostelium lacteum]
MVSKILPNLIKKLLCNYIEGLDSLSIPFWKGEIVLENLILKREVFESPDLPFELERGVIKKIVINIPLLRFLKDPILVTVDGIFMLFARKDLKSADFQSSQTSQQQQQKNNNNNNNLKPSVTKDEIEKIKSSIGMGDENTSGGEYSEGWLFKLMKQLIKCIKLQVTNIHICYQDCKTSGPDQQFSIGMTLESFSITTTDENLIQVAPKVMSKDQMENRQSTYKLASIFNFSLYWNSQFGITKKISPPDMDFLLMHSIPRKNIKLNHHYIIQPVTFFLKLVLVEEKVESIGNDGVQTTFNNRFNVEMGLRQFDFQLLDTQYRDILSLHSFTQDWKKFIKYQAFRPKVPIKGNAREWWYFAYRSIISDFRKNKNDITWKELQENKKLRSCYIKLYNQRILCGKGSKLENRLIEEIEKRVSYEDIVLFRTIADQILQEKKQQDIMTHFVEYQPWWLKGWIGFTNSYRQHYKPQSTNQSCPILSNEELSFLEKYLKLNLRSIISLNESSVSYNVDFFIKKCTISIKDWREGQIIVPLTILDIDNINAKLENGAKTTKIQFSASNMQLLDKCSQDTKFESIIIEKSQVSKNPYDRLELEENKKFIQMSLVVYPPENITDYTLQLKIEPMYFVNSKPFVDTMIPFFTNANQDALDSLKYSFLKKISMLQEMLFLEVKHLVRNQKSADININISVPTLVFPESYDDEDTKVLICELGQFIFKTQPHSYEWESIDFSRVNERDEDGLFTKYKKLLHERYNWWRDNCPMNIPKNNVEIQPFYDQVQQVHRATVDAHMKEQQLNQSINTSRNQDQPYVEDDEVEEEEVDEETDGNDQTDSKDDMSVSSSNSGIYKDKISDEPELGDEWNDMDININNAQFYDGIVIKCTGINIRICRFSEITKYEHLMAPCNLYVFIQLCSHPYDLNLSQMICRCELSEIKMDVTDKQLYDIAKIAGKNGFIEYFVSPKGASAQDLANKYEVVQTTIAKENRFDLDFLVSKDTKFIFNSRKKTKEQLTKTTLLRFYFTTSTVDMQLHYLDSTIQLKLDRLRCRSLAKFLHMEVLVDIGFIEVVDSNSIQPMLQIFEMEKFNGKPLNQSSLGTSQSISLSSSKDSGIPGVGSIQDSNILNVTQLPLGLTDSVLVLHLTSISKNSLEYDYIDFIGTFHSKHVRINLIKECLMALITICGTVISDTQKFHEKKQSILTVEGSSYKDRIGHFRVSSSHEQNVMFDNQLTADEWDPNDLKSKIKFFIPSFGLTLSSMESDIVSFTCSDIKVDGIFQIPLLDVDLSVGSMKLIDHSLQDGLYGNILTTVARQQNPVVRMHIVSHALDKAKQHGYNSNVNIIIGKINLVLLSHTINQVQYYIYDVSSTFQSHLSFLLKKGITVIETPATASHSHRHRPHRRPTPMEAGGPVEDKYVKFNEDFEEILAEDPNFPDGVKSKKLRQPPPSGEPTVEIMKKKARTTNLEITIDKCSLTIPKNPDSKSSLKCNVSKIVFGVEQSNITSDIIFAKIFGIHVLSFHNDKMDPIITEPIKFDIELLHEFETNLQDQSLLAKVTTQSIYLKLCQYQYNLLFNIYQQNIAKLFDSSGPSNPSAVNRNPKHLKDHIKDKIFSVSVEVTDLIEFNLEDENTQEKKFFSLNLQKPMILLDIYKNSEMMLSIRSVGFCIRDKNKIVLPPDQFQEILSITGKKPSGEGPSYLATHLGTTASVISNMEYFEVMKMQYLDSIMYFSIDIQRLHVFVDLHWVYKLFMFLSPIVDPESCKSVTKQVTMVPIQQTQTKPWKIFMDFEIKVEKAHILVGSLLSSKSDLVLLLDSEIGVKGTIGNDTLLKIMIEYTCHKGLFGRKDDPLKKQVGFRLTMANMISTSSGRDLLVPKNSVEYLYDQLKKHSSVFLEQFNTSVQFCLVPEGNQFYFIELNNLSVVFSANSYRFILDLYELFQNIIYDTSKSKPITEEGINLRRSLNSPSNIPIPISTSQRRNSIAHLNIEKKEKQDNKFYLMKTKSVEMLKAHQTRMKEKYPDPNSMDDLQEGLKSSSPTPKSEHVVPTKVPISFDDSSDNSFEGEWGGSPQLVSSSDKSIKKILFSQCSFTFKNIQILVLDDLSKHKLNTPIFNFKVAFALIKLMIKSNTFSVDLESSIQMDYFNNRIAFWEPFLEPWLCKVFISIGQEVNMELTSNDLLNVNLTIPLMDNISLFLKNYSKEFGYPFTLICAPPDTKTKKNFERLSLLDQIKKKHKKKNAQKFSYAPFYIRNRTGSRIRYRLETHDGKPVEGILLDREVTGSDKVGVVNIEGYGNFFEIASGGSAPIKFLPDMQLNLETFSQLVLSVELLGVEKAIVVPLDKIKTYDYPVFIDSITESKIHANIKIKRGSKFITILLPIVIHNLANFPVDIATVSAGFGGSQLPTYSSTIRMKQSRAPLPVNRMKNMLLKLKPSGEEYKWSAETLDINNIQDQDPEGFYTCVAKNGEKILYIKSFIQKKQDYYKVRFLSMIKVTNLLPFPIQYILKSPLDSIPQPKRTFESKFFTNESKVYETAFNDQFKVSLKIDNEEYEWSETKSIDEQLDSQKINVLQIHHKHVGNLYVNMEYLSINGQRKLLFYNQYWIYNKTGLNLWCSKTYHAKDYKEGSISLNHQEYLSNFARGFENEEIIVPPEQWYSHHEQLVDPIMFSFKKTKEIENIIRIQVGKSLPSSKITISSIGDRSLLTVTRENSKHHSLFGRKKKHTNNNLTYFIGMSIDLAPNLKTKILLFSPRFIFNNHFTYSVIIKQVGTENHITIPPGASVPLYYFEETGLNQPYNLQMKLDHPSFSWSPPFNICMASDYTFKTFSMDTQSKELSVELPQYIRIKPCLEAAVVVVIIVGQDAPPYKIHNRTQYPLTVCQKKGGVVQEVPKDSFVAFAWDFPLEDHILEVQVSGYSHRYPFRVDKIKSFTPIEFTNNLHELVIIKVLVEADESTRVLTLDDQTKINKNDELEEVLKQSFRFHVKGIGVSIINANPTELLYVSIGDILAEYYSSSFLQKLELKVSSMQVDNQLSKITPFSHPVLLFAEAQSTQPFLLLRVVRSMKMTNIDYYHHVSLKVQELNIKVEEKFLYVLLDFFESLDLSFWTGKNTPKALTKVDLFVSVYDQEIGRGFIDTMILRAMPTIYGKKMYFESLDIDPISVYLTFDLSNKTGSIQTLESAPMVRSFRRIGFVLVSFQQAHIFLNNFKLSHAFGSNEELLAPIFRHYMTEGLSEVYKILGTFNLFGNPIGLVTNFGIGFKEFFENMGKSLIGRNEFGMSRGSKSLAKHSVYGIFDSGAKFTGSAGKVLSSISMDKHYILERQYISGESPVNVLQGIILGGRMAKIGFKRSIVGVGLLPYEGGKADGVTGALKGVGKGVAGLILKPTAACFDFASKCSEGIKNSTQLNLERKRIRYPRPLFSDQPLKIYNSAESFGNFLFLTNLITSGKFKRINANQINVPLYEVSRDERYVYHLIYKNKKTLLFTNHRIIYLKDTDGIRVKFNVKYQAIKSVIEEENCVKIKIFKPYRIGLVHKNKTRAKYLKINCTGDEKHYIYERVLEHVKTYSILSIEELTADNIPVPPTPPPPPRISYYNGTQYVDNLGPVYTNNNVMGKIQPIIFQDQDSMKPVDQMNPILQNLLFQIPNQNINVPIWVSQGYNPPKPPQSTIPQRFQQSNTTVIYPNNNNLVIPLNNDPVPVVGPVVPVAHTPNATTTTTTTIVPAKTPIVEQKVQPINPMNINPTPIITNSHHKSVTYLDDNNVNTGTIDKKYFKSSTPKHSPIPKKENKYEGDHKYDIALNTIIQLQRMQTQQMQQLQKNHDDLQKLLFQQQSTQLENIKKQQENIQSILSIKNDENINNNKPGDASQ